MDMRPKIKLTLVEKRGKKKIAGVCLAVPGPYIRKESIGNDMFQVSEFEQLSQIDIRTELEEKGYRIERIDCTAKEMDMKWLDELEDMVFPKNPSL